MNRFHFLAKWAGRTGRMVWILAALGLTPVPPAFAADASGVDACIRRPVVFDGTDPLRYYSVVGQGNPVLRLGDLSRCNAGGKTVSCGNTVALHEGDVVAVGKVCGENAYVQYIGATRVFIGWMDSKSISVMTNRKPLEKGYNSSPPVFHYKLIKGADVPVCAAYLQRLNVTTYKMDSWGNSSPPYCDRGEDDTVDGFAALHRVYLNADEIVAWSRRVWNFESGECPSSNELCNRRWRGSGPVISKSDAVSALDKNLLVAWKYKSDLDVENNGNPERLLVWFGLWGGHPPCGGGYEFAGKEISNTPRPQHIYILDATGKRIEDQQTLTVFGKTGAKWRRPGEPNLRPYPGEKFRGENMQPFEYRGVYYFDAAVVEEKNQEAGDVMPHGLDVYERRKDATHLVCKVGMTVDYKQN